MIVGTEWLVEALDADENALRRVETLRRVFDRIISDLDLKTVGEPHWHKFAGEGGVTGLVMLTESHLACHTYPEFRTATFNLYCCRARPAWDWETNLKEMLGAETVNFLRIERGNLQAEVEDFKSEISHLKSEISYLKSEIPNLKSEMLDLKFEILYPDSQNAGGEH